jgi:hypothetical protein
VKTLVNRRRRSVTRHSRRRSYKRNPGGALRFAGFSLPPIQVVAAVGAGFVAAPIVTGIVSSYTPDSIKNNAFGQWAIKIVGAIAPGLIVRKTLSASFGNNMLIGGGAALVLDAVRTFAPGMIPGLGYQPMLGQYQTRGGRRLAGYYDNPQTGLPFASTARSQMLPNVLMNTPDRLSPQNRF